jgi:hypothetical protein
MKLQKNLMLHLWKQQSNMYFILGSLNKTFSNSDLIASDDRRDSEQWIGKGMEGNSYGLGWGTSSETEENNETLLRIAGLRLRFEPGTYQIQIWVWLTRCGIQSKVTCQTISSKTNGTCSQAYFSSTFNNIGTKRSYDTTCWSISP